MNPPLACGQVLDGYHLVRFIGRGGFGEVWLCRSESMGDYRALKFIPTTHADRFDKEYEALLHYRKAASRLRSPHMVPIEHANRNEGGLYYVMPLADGIAGTDPADPAWQPLSLAAKVHAQAGQPAWFTSQEIIALIAPVLDALQTLSEAGLVHRDVKPENILIFNGQPCLGDISLLGADASVITRRGTPGYGTPSWYVDGHPDMYGAAATLFHLLTGNLPDKMGRSAFIWPPQGEASLPTSEQAEWKRLHGVIRRATDEKVAERFSDYAAMAGNVSMAGQLRTASSSKPRLSRILVSTLTVVVGIAVAAIVFGRFRSKIVPQQPLRPVAVEPNATNAAHEPPVSADSNPVPAKSPEEIRTTSPSNRFESTRQKIIQRISSILTHPHSLDAEGGSLDIDAYSRVADVRIAFEKRDYPAALAALDTVLVSDGTSPPEPECVLLRSLLLQKMGRDKESTIEIAKIAGRKNEFDTTKSELLEKLETRVMLWEALGDFKEGEYMVSGALATVLGDISVWKAGTAEKLYHLRARMRILLGNFAGVLADETATLAIPLHYTEGGSIQTDSNSEARGRQYHLNLTVTQWEMLAQEFPAYADYLVAHGSPEPQADLRNPNAEY